MLQIPNFKRYIATETLGAIIGAAGAVGGATINGVASGKMNRRAEKFNREEAAAQRAFSEEQTAKQNAWNYQMWKEATEYDNPVNQVERLRDAGLNPLFYGLDGNASQSAPSAAQPLGYERAEAPRYNNPISDAIDAFTGIRSMEKDIELKNAQIDKIKSDTKGQELDNEFKDKTMDARVEAETLANSLTKEQIGEVKKKMQVMDEDIKKKIEETKSEVERQALIAAQTAVQKASEKEIVELLPYRSLLLQAETTAQKAAACSSYWNAMYQKGLVNDGYLDALTQDMVNQAKASAYEEGIQWNKARQAAAEADAQSWRNSVRNGTTFKSDSFGAKAANTLLQATSTVAEALGGSLVPLVGAGMVAKGVGKAGNKGSVDSPTYQGKGTLLYGADGQPAVTSTWQSNY